MDLTLADFVVFVLAGSTLMVVIFAMGSRILNKRAEKSALAQRVICRLCLHAFEIRQSGRIVHCPHCDALNERGRSRKLG